MQFFYLIALCLSLAGLALLDHRWQLALWHNWRQTCLTIGIGVSVFIAWDLLGIWTGIFIHGNSSFILPMTIVPEFPIEEIFFLTLLCYCTLIIYRGSSKLWQRT